MKSLKQFVFTLVLAVMSICAFAQSTESQQSSPVSQGDFLVGVASANVPVSDLQLSASVGYATNAADALLAELEKTETT